MSITRESSIDRRRWLRVGLRVGLIVGIFAAIPWAILELALEVVGESRLAQLRESGKVQHERALSLITQIDDEARFAGRLVRSVFLRMRKRGLAQGRRDLQAIDRQLPGVFERYFFDGTGRVIPEVSSRGRGRKFLETCYRLIGDLRRGGKPAPEQLGMLRELWKMARVETLDQYPEGKPMPIGEDPTAGYCCFEVPEKLDSQAVSGYLAFFRPEALPRDYAPRQVIRVVQARHPDIQFGWVDLERSPPVVFPKRLERWPTLRSAILKSLASYNTGYADGQILLTTAQRKRDGHFVAIRDLPETIPPGATWFLRLAFLAWAVVLTARTAAGTSILETRISWRIVGLFLFSVGLPAILLQLGVYRALEDHLLILQDTLERSMRAKLRQLDERFPLEVVRVENLLRGLKGRALQRTDQAGVLRVLEKVRKEKSITEFLVIDSHGRSLWELRKAINEAVSQRYRIGRVMAREIIKRLNRDDSVDAGTLINESVSSLAGGIAEAGSWELFQRNLGQFTPFTLGNEGCFMLFDALVTPRGMAEMVYCAVMFRDWAESRFLRKHRRALERQPDLTWRVNFWARSRLARSIYSNKALEKDTETIGKAVETQRASIRKIVETPQGREMWIGQPGQNLQGYVFVARAPLEPLERQVGRLRELAVALLALLILTTMVTGFFLSEQLLVPIQNIRQGIQAIRVRNFQHRLPVQARDELGEVSALMNQVMEGMHDLSVARAIQENLFPRGELRVGALTIFGRSRTLTDVGGDYFDYFRTDDGRLFGVVGDVSGHGVSAALIMGMAKCFFTVSDRRGSSLDEILTAFNLYLFRTIQRMKMMTLIVFRWDPETGILQFGNAGHVSPSLRRNREGVAHDPGRGEGIVEEIVMHCMPLGVSPRAKFVTRDVSLAPGDAVLLCTDGFPEAKDSRDEQLGYGVPAEWFGQAGDLPPREVVEALFQRLDAFCGEAPAADDVTMICLRVDRGGSVA